MKNSKLVAAITSLLMVLTTFLPVKADIGFTGGISGFSSGGVALPVSPTNGGTGLSALGTGLQQIRVNAGGTALEYFTPSAGGVTSLAPYSSATYGDSGIILSASSGAISAGTYQNVYYQTIGSGAHTWSSIAQIGATVAFILSASTGGISLPAGTSNLYGKHTRITQYKAGSVLTVSPFAGDFFYSGNGAAGPDGTAITVAYGQVLDLQFDGTGWIAQLGGPGASVITGAGFTQVVLTVAAPSTQSGHVQDWAVNGSNVAAIGADGTLSNFRTVSTGNNTITLGSNVVGQTVTASSGQTAHLIDVNSFGGSGGDLASVDINGALRCVNMFASNGVVSASTYYGKVFEMDPQAAPGYFTTGAFLSYTDNADSKFKISTGNAGVILGTVAEDLTGNWLLQTVGAGLGIKSGSNARISNGNETLSMGTVTITNSTFTTNTQIYTQITGGTTATLSPLKCVMASGSCVCSTPLQVTSDMTFTWFAVEKL